MAYGSVTYALAVKQDGLIIVSSLLLTGVILYGLLVYRIESLSDLMRRVRIHEEIIRRCDIDCPRAGLVRGFI